MKILFKLKTPTYHDWALLDQIFNEIPGISFQGYYDIFPSGKQAVIFSSEEDFLIFKLKYGHKFI